MRAAVRTAEAVSHSGEAVVMLDDHGPRSFLFDGKTIRLNDEGFLSDPSDWSEPLAAAWARVGGLVEMGDPHWRVLRYLREYHGKYGVAPMIRKLCRECNVTIDQLFDMFPDGPARGACRLAGLPSPTGCV